MTKSSKTQKQVITEPAELSEPDDVPSEDDDDYSEHDDDHPEHEDGDTVTL